MLDDLNKSHDPKILHVGQLAVEIGRHAIPADADDAQVRAPRLDLAQQLRAVQVAGGLACDDKQGATHSPLLSGRTFQCAPKMRLSSGTMGRPSAVVGISAGKNTVGYFISRALILDGNCAGLPSNARFQR